MADRRHRSVVYLRYLSLGTAGGGAIAAAVGLSVALAVLSYRYVERPVLRLIWPRTRILWSGAAAMAAGLLVGGGVYAAKGLPGRYDAADRALARAAREGRSPLRERCHATERKQIRYTDACALGAAGATPDAAVWGDSFGVETAMALGEAAARHGGAVLQLTASACPPAIGYGSRYNANCASFTSEVAAALTRDEPIQTVYLAANYDLYHDAAFFAALRDSVMQLRAAGKRVVLIYPIPRMPFDVPTALELLHHRGAPLDRYGVPQAAFERTNAATIRALDDIAARTGAERIVPAARLCDHGLCRAYRDGLGPLYFDERHLSMAGARLALGLPAGGR